MTPCHPIQKAVELAGGQSAVARELRISPQAVGAWVRNRKIPPTRVLQLESLAAAGARKKRRKPVTRHQLSPELYPQAA